ncbi:hypothetical protein B4113_2859 [Geobacillus sp. B4113_201601]|nr:hypothetical protein B4113_2859 [Geobacillus sp. B4113_201601]
MASMGISKDTAWKVVDLVNAGASIWTIVSVILAGGGIIAMGYAALVYLIKKRIEEAGAAAAVSW